MTDLKRETINYAVAIQTATRAIANGDVTGEDPLEPKSWRAFLDRQIADLRAAYEIFNAELVATRPAALRRRAHTLPHPGHLASILELHARLDTHLPLARRLAMVDASLTCARRIRGRSARETQLTQGHCTRAEILVAMKMVDAARRALRAAARHDRHAYGLPNRLFVRALICEVTSRTAEATRLHTRVRKMDDDLRAHLGDVLARRGGAT
jgi:hypothetical protein